VNAILGVVQGLGAAATCAAGFYLAGLILTPRHWDSRLGGVSLPVVGAALYVVVCWAAVTAWQVPLTSVSAVLVVTAVVLAAIRFRGMAAAIVAHTANSTFAAGALVFAAFYVVAYLVARPPAAELFLPPTWTGHLDLLTQARYARQVLLFGSTDLEAATFDVRRSPAVTVLLAVVSTFYRTDSLSASLPLQFAVVALVGLAATGICRSLFRLSALAALSIAGIVMTSAIVNALARAYRLEALMAVPVLLYLVWATARARSDSPIAALITAFGSAYALLLFAEPAALPAAFAMQALAIVLRRVSTSAASRVAIAAAVAMAVLAVAFHDHVQWAFANRTMADVAAPAGLAVATLVMGGIAFVAFNVDWLSRLAPTQTDRRLAIALTVYAAIALIVANVAMHASTRARAQVRIPAAWRNIEHLQERPLRELTVKLTRDPGGLLAAMTRYYLPATTLHVIAPGARLSNFETVSRQTPLLVQNFGCEGVGHADTVSIPDVGCALLASPSLTLDTVYPFNRTFLAIDFANMSEREQGGRWSTGTTMRIRLLTDPERTPVARPLHVNLLLNPFLPPDVGLQRLVFAWGANKKGMIAVGKSGWISIPVNSEDWAGNRVWELPIAIDFPDNRTILFDALSISESARGPLVK
jgi:hypothetical protein